MKKQTFKTLAEFLLIIFTAMGLMDSGLEAAGAVLYESGSSIGNLEKKISSFPKETWKQVEDGAAVAEIKGDSILMNDKLVSLIRKGDAGISIYAKGESGWTLRGTLFPIVGGKKASIKSLNIVEVDPGETSVKCGLGKGLSLLLTIKIGEPILKATAQGKVERLRIEAPCRFGVLPDFFADDLSIDARDIVVEKTEVPSDNFFLHMLGKDEAILAAVWEKNVRDIELRIGGSQGNRMIVATDVFFGEGGSIWTAVLEEKGIWHEENISLEDSLKGKALTDWDVPFMAKWKGNFTLEDGAISSSPFVGNKGAQGFAGMRYSFHNHSLKSIRHSAKKAYRVKLLPQAKLGGGQGSVHKDFKLNRYNGPMVAYPIARFDTPIEKFCIDDLMRLCLGMGACEYVLDVEARAPEYRGIFTCSYNKTPGMFISDVPFYDTDREKAKVWKEDRGFMKPETEAVLLFIKFIQDRINGYLDLRLELLAYLKEAEAKYPGQSDFIARLKKNMNQATPVFKLMIKPEVRANGVEVFTPWMKDIMKAMKIDTGEQAKKGNTAIQAKHIGDPQDSRLAALRRQVKQWRSMASMEMAKNPKAAPISKKIREMTEKALRNPSNYERETVW